MDDLYPGTLGTESNPAGLAEILSRMDDLNADMRKLHKKKKGGKEDGKKKLKKQFKRLQEEHQQLKNFLYLLAVQQQQQQTGKKKGKKKKKGKESTPAWWHDALANSMPVVFDNLTRPQPQYLSQNSKPLYLGDGKNRK